MAIVFALGSNGAGQLGIGHKEDVSVPKPVLFRPGAPASPVAKVAAGGNHTLLLTESGELYWSGKSSSSACGLTVGPDSPTEPQFQRAVLGDDSDEDFTSPIKLVAATWETSIITRLDKEGKHTLVYTLGCGSKGELGLGPAVQRAPRATRVPDFPPPGTEVVDLAAGMGHVVAVLSSGEAYGWGNGRKGQLGAPDELIHLPRRMEGVGFEIRRAVCGKDFTCLVGDADKGMIAVLGSDKWGVKTSAPSAVPGWKDVGASWGTVCILQSDGMVQSWGRNDHGQMAPPNPLKVSQIAIGSEHALALTENGDVLAWGWGEHGNCGPQVDANGDVKGRWNVIASSKYVPPDTKITRIGAGCATSWISLSEPS